MLAPSLVPGTVSLATGRRPDGTLTVEIRPASGKDAIAGTLVLPWVTPAGQVRTFSRAVHPPPPWRRADVEVMWRASRRLHLARTMNAPALLVGTSRRISLLSLDWERLDDAVRAARRLLRGWPQSSIRSRRIAPLELPAGLEDGRTTEHLLSLGRIESTALGGARVPVHAVFVTAHARPWRSRLLSSTARQLHDRVEEAAQPWLEHAGTEPPGLRELLVPLRLVAERSQDPRLGRERQPSSWPPQARVFLAAALAAGVTAQQTTSGRRAPAPVCRLWQIYEDWVVERVATILERILRGSRVETGEAFPLRWQPEPGLDVMLYHQPAFRWDRPLSMAGQDWVAVLGAELRPDAALVVKRAGHCSRVLLIDAKLRVINDDVLATEAGKYLWGIRRADQTPVCPAVDRVELIAPNGGPGPIAPKALARADSVHAAPLAGQDGTRRPLNTGLVAAWLAELDGLPRSSAP